MGARGAGRRVSGSKCINNDRAGSWAERSKGRVRVGVLEGGGGPDCSTYFHIAYDGALFLQSKESGDTQSGLHLDNGRRAQAATAVEMHLSRCIQSCKNGPQF